MNLHFIRTRTFIFHVALVALYVLPAIAVAAVPSAADLLGYNSRKTSRSRNVVVAFDNFTLQPRQSQIGAHSQLLPREKNETAGAKAQADTSMNSRPRGTALAAVSETSPLREATIH